MAENIFDSFKNIFKGKDKEEKELNENELRVNVSIMEKKYDDDELVEASIILKHLLEIYGTKKKKNHRLKGREFIHFILSSKHKNLKTEGYTHWEHINKIIHLNQKTIYPYHKQNLREAIDFYKKEIKGIKVIDTIV